MGSPDGHDTARGLLQKRAYLRVLCGLQIEHSCNELKTVLHSMIDLFDQHLLVFERRLQTSLVALALDRHAQNIRRALQESDIVFAELALGPTVHLEHSVGRPIALEDDVYGAPDAVRGEEFR